MPSGNTANSRKFLLCRREHKYFAAKNHIARRGQSSRKKHRPAIRAGLPPCHREGPRLPGALIGRGRKMLSLFPTRRVKLYTARRETKIRNLYFSRFRRGGPCIDARSRAARPPRGSRARKALDNRRSFPQADLPRPPNSIEIERPIPGDHGRQAQGHRNDG